MDKVKLNRGTFISSTNFRKTIENHPKSKLFKPKNVIHRRNKTEPKIIKDKIVTPQKEVPAKKNTDYKPQRQRLLKQQSKDSIHLPQPTFYHNNPHNKQEEESDNTEIIDNFESTDTVIQIETVSNKNNNNNSNTNNNNTNNNTYNNNNINNNLYFEQQQQPQCITEIFNLLNTIFFLLKESAENNDKPLPKCPKKGYCTNRLSQKEKRKIETDLNISSLKRKKAYTEKFELIENSIEQMSDLFKKVLSEREISVIKEDTIGDFNSSLLEDFLVKNSNIEENESLCEDSAQGINEFPNNKTSNKKLINLCPTMTTKKNNLNSYVITNNNNISTKDTEENVKTQPGEVHHISQPKEENNNNNNKCIII